MAEKSQVKAGYWPLIIISGVALMALAAAFYLSFFASAGSMVNQPAQAEPAQEAHVQADRAIAAAGMDVRQREAMEAVVRDYILKNPEIITDAVTILQQRESNRKLTNVKEQVEEAFPGTVLGNPDGDVTLVEFSDYACGYCKASVAHVQRLIADDSKLRVIVRELPILSPASADAARWALAAAKQGKFKAFHDAMYSGARPSDESIQAAARKAGLDMAAAQSFADSQTVKAEIAKNLQIAQSLSFSGTPSWIIGGQVLEGAVGPDALAAAIAKARANKP